MTDWGKSQNPAAQEKKLLYKQLFTLVLPIAFQNLMSSLVTASDAMMLGFLEQDSLSASSLAGQIAFIFQLFSLALLNGCNVMAAQFWGKGDKNTVEKVLAITMRYTLLIGAVFTIASLAVPGLLMRIFTSDPVLIEKGAVYLRTVAFSYVLTAFSQIYLGIMKVCGQAGKSSLIGSTSVVLNILLNGCLIFGWGFFPRLEIAGAAIATVIARIYEVICVLLVNHSGKCVRLRVREMFRLSPDPLHREYWHYTAPSLMNRIGWGTGVAMYSVIMGHLGSDAAAANSIASIVRTMIASLCGGIGSGTGILIGNLLGRKELEKAKTAGRSFVRFSIVIGVLSGLVILAISPLILHFVHFTPQAKHYLTYMLCFASYYIIGNSINTTVIGGIFPAGGDTLFGMRCDIITLWAVVVPLGLLAAFVWDLPVPAVAAILTLDEFVKMPAVYHHFVQYRWVRNITD